MTQNDNPQFNPPPPPPTLDYRSPSEPRRLSGGQVAAGTLLSAAVLMGAVFVGILASIGGGSGILLWLIIGGAIAGINVLAIFLYRRGRARGMAIGLWLGFALVGLIEGICFGGRFV